MPVSHIACRGCVKDLFGSDAYLSRGQVRCSSWGSHKDERAEQEQGEQTVVRQTGILVVEKGIKKAGTGGKQGIKTGRESEERMEDSWKKKKKLLILANWKSSEGWCKSKRSFRLKGKAHSQRRSPQKVGILSPQAFSLVTNFPEQSPQAYWSSQSSGTHTVQTFYLLRLVYKQLGTVFTVPLNYI